MNEIQQAAFELQREELKRLIRCNAELDGTLLAACSSHDADPAIQAAIIRLLLAAGANLHESDQNGVTPLHRAVRFRNLGAVKELITQGADVNSTDRRSGSTPLHRAVTNTGAPKTAGKSSAALEIARLLLASGADPTIVNKAGKTPADYAVNDDMAAVFSGV